MSPKKKVTKPLDIYVRVSRVGGRDGESFISPTVQEERCRALATARGYEVGRVFTDLDQSGGTMDRPAFNQALARIEVGESGGIIVARIDRFARTMQGALNTLEIIEKAGGFLIECDGDWDTSTPMGRFGRDLVLRISQLFREQIAESWNISRKKAVERGVHISAAPAGYRKQADSVLEPSEHGAAVKAAFEMRAKGASQSEIARHLIKEGVPTAWAHRAASSWSIRAVQLLLENRVYLGEARSGAYVNADAHEPLVSRALFRAVQKRKGTAKAASKNGGEGPLLGGGLLRCASCGGRLSRDTTKARGKTYPFYRCKSNPACPARVGISANRMEPYLVAAALERHADLAYELPREQTDEAAELESRLSYLTSELEAVDQDEAAGELSVREAGRVRTRLEAQRAEVEVALSAAPTGKPEWVSIAPEALREMLFERPGQDVYGEPLDELTPRDIRTVRAFIGDIIDRAVVKPGRGPVEERVEIHWGGVLLREETEATA